MNYNEIRDRIHQIETLDTQYKTQLKHQLYEEIIHAIANGDIAPHMSRYVCCLINQKLIDSERV